MAIRKVRWSTKCAGGCGEWLLAGRRATFAYGNYWCDTCVFLHKNDLRLLRK